MEEKQIVLTEKQLEKVLENTNVSKNHFLNKLTHIKTEEYKNKQLKNNK